jgi:hypothetical protein
LRGGTALLFLWLAFDYDLATRYLAVRSFKWRDALGVPAARNELSLGEGNAGPAEMLGSVEQIFG